MRYVKRVIKQSYHRNGMTGAGFIVSLFELAGGSVGGGRDATIMLGITMMPEMDGATRKDAERHTAILDLNLAHEGTIEMRLNSWRGDNFGPELVAAWEKDNGPLYGEGS